MTNREQALGRIELAAEGIGGIDSTAVTLDRGVNILEGRNATNRTSFLRALMAGLGSNDVSLKGDREAGSIELEVDGETYTRTLRRVDGDVRFGGEPYLSDTTEADLFAFLLESNEARQAVSRGDDLREIIMQPVDTADIDRQIRELQAERETIDDRIELLEQQRQQLPGLKEEQTTLESALEAERETLADLRSELEAADADVETRQEEQRRLEETLENLSDARNDLEDVRYRLETEREALDSDREELAEAETSRDELPETSEQRLAEVENRISELRQRKRTYDSRISKLSRIVQFNEEMLDGEGVLGDLFEEDTPVTDELLEDAETTCWTCGSSVATTEIEDMLDRLRELSQSQRRERNDIGTELEELTDERDRLDEARRRREELSERVTSLESNIERREETIEDLEDEEAELRDRLDDLEAEAEQLDDVSDNRVLDLHKKVNEQEVTVERLERELEDVTERIESLEEKSDEIATLERKREQITQQLTELRTRIDRLETEGIDAFNEHMADLVNLLEYDNLERIWIEKRTEGTDSGDQNREATFDLHVVRTTEDGVTYQDTVDHLSESEREVVGLVFALAGYLVHEVYETVPFMLLDSLEAIDSKRIAVLVDYLADYAPTIVAALLPEDARALDDSYTHIEEV